MEGFPSSFSTGWRPRESVSATPVGNRSQMESLAVERQSEYGMSKRKSRNQSSPAREGRYEGRNNVKRKPVKKK